MLFLSWLFLAHVYNLLVNTQKSSVQNIHQNTLKEDLILRFYKSDSYSKIITFLSLHYTKYKAKNTAILPYKPK